MNSRLKAHVKSFLFMHTHLDKHVAVRPKQGLHTTTRPSIFVCELTGVQSMSDWAFIFNLNF